MSFDFDDPAVAYLRLLQRAGLEKAEDILRHGPEAIFERLSEANREISAVGEPPSDDFLRRLIHSARRKGFGEITIEDLREASDRFREEIGGRGGRSMTRGLEEASLPGREDFEPWRRKDDDEDL